MDEIQYTAFNYTRQAVHSLDEDLIRSCGLLAVGVGFKVAGGVPTDEPSIKAFVTRKLPLKDISPSRVVPPSIQFLQRNIRTDVEEMLPPTAPAWLLDMPTDLRALQAGNRFRHRPITGGNSVSHYRAPLGTVAAEVLDVRSGGLPAILSCNHVLADLDRGVFGDPIVQPALDDGGRTPIDTCGFLYRWMPLNFGFTGVNFIDAAIGLVDLRSSIALIDFVGLPTGIRSGNSMSPGDFVMKVGRTTRLTTGTVVAVHVSGWITYPPILGGKGAAFFKDQIVTTGMAAFGDSGSLLFDASFRAVGMLFGGSPTHTFYNDIVHIQNFLGIVFRAMPH